MKGVAIVMGTSRMSEVVHGMEPLELVERAARELPLCQLCGAPTVPVARDGVLWLECSDLGQSRSRLRRLLALDFAGHTRQVLADLRRVQHAA
jgi:hypothetical protein